MLKNMDIKKIAQYQKSLEERKKKLLAEIAADSTPESFGGDVDAGDEESDESEEQGNHLAAAQSLKEDVHEIDLALGQIKIGKYGTCTKCGVAIEEKVLDAAPESIFCRMCKKEK